MVVAPVCGIEPSGDGKTDRAAVNPTNGQWFVLTVAGTAPSWLPYGWSFPEWDPEFEVVPGDFDGDGRADAVAVDVARAHWYIYPSSGFHVY